MKDIVFEKNNMPMTNSLLVAEVFDINHKDLLRIIRTLIQDEQEDKEEIGGRKFAPTSSTNYILSSYTVQESLQRVIMSKKVCFQKN